MWSTWEALGAGTLMHLHAVTCTLKQQSVSHSCFKQMSGYLTVHEDVLKHFLKLFISFFTCALKGPLQAGEKSGIETLL